MEVGLEGGETGGRDESKPKSDTGTGMPTLDGGVNVLQKRCDLIWRGEKGGDQKVFIAEMTQEVGLIRRNERAQMRQGSSRCTGAMRLIHSQGPMGRDGEKVLSGLILRRHIIPGNVCVGPDPESGLECGT